MQAHQGSELTRRAATAPLARSPPHREAEAAQRKDVPPFLFHRFELTRQAAFPVRQCVADGPHFPIA